MIEGGLSTRLAALGREARLAGDVELDAMADDVAGNVVAYRPHEAFDCRRAEFADVAALDADGVMVVLDPGEAIPWGAVQEVQTADHSRSQEELDRPVNLSLIHI